MMTKGEKMIWASTFAAEYATGEVPYDEAAYSAYQAVKAVRLARSEGLSELEHEEEEVGKASDLLAEMTDGNGDEDEDEDE
jgi:hypothetical protein